MSNIISKQAEIEPEAISKWKKEFREYVDSLDITRDDWKGIIEYIDELPSVQPERPKGRWIPTASEKGRHECSRCHEYAPCYQDGSEHLSTFCVLCGAKMERGEQE